MKLSELREKTAVELAKLRDEKHVELAKLRIKQRVGQIKTHQLVDLKRSIAQINTIITEQSRNSQGAV